ncbi:TetR/AcrR family transcriptional regulator [Microbacterium sp. No. 7]|uniref:TetR/AcrR family transcriptional regulator n=1 Tax=Microbacterium sp. No. 7 TaxID=1714373 RepID=UPI0006D2104F|nr:TetR/AcrR family transcriptional regulator [Microbacterium sp. No. 7]ALJ18429.1 hypothetical protein AOA12_00230 [Microbacterium sp. No. 7]
MPERTQRADARRNYDLLVNAAREAIGQNGTDIAMDDIARRAGVGSGTLYRHFPTRHALLVAAYSGVAEEYAEVGRRLLAEYRDGRALRAWLSFLASSIAECRGLAIAALTTGTESTTPTCAFHEELQKTAAFLLADAREHGKARPDITAADLLTLANAIAGACEADPKATERLLDLAYAGVAPR